VDKGVVKTARGLSTMAVMWAEVPLLLFILERQLFSVWNFHETLLISRTCDISFLRNQLALNRTLRACTAEVQKQIE
jgi:hypothetical protein